MNPIQESKQELEASIRYAENAISSAKQTIESMAAYQEQTGREQALQAEVDELRDIIDRMGDDSTGDSVTIKQLYEEREMLEKNVKYLRDENERLKQDKPTMPVIPKAVAIAIFREGLQHGVESACTELEGQTIEVNENEYCGGFEVSFSKEIDLDFELDLDWMRDKVGNYSEEFVVDALSTLCSDKEFECRIHGVDDEEILRRDWKNKDDEAKDSASA